MIFVDSDVLESAVGEDDWRRKHAQSFFLRALDLGTPLCTSSLAALEAISSCGRKDRRLRANAVRELIRGRMTDISELAAEDLFAGARLRDSLPHLSEVQLVKVAACRRRGIGAIMTFDPALRRTVRFGSRGLRASAAELARAHQEKWREEHGPWSRDR